MVHIINKSAGGDGELPLTPEELATLYRNAAAGDPIARLRLDMLPKGERLLAQSIFKAYNGEVKPLPTVTFKDGAPVVKKKKVKKPKVVDPFQPIIPNVQPLVKSFKRKSEKEMRNDLLNADLNSCDPAIRERARAWKNGEL